MTKDTELRVPFAIPDKEGFRFKEGRYQSHAAARFSLGRRDSET